VAETNTSLTEAPFVQLQKEDFVLLHTGAEDGSPTLSTISCDHLDEVPFPLARVDLDVAEMRNAMFFGARLTTLPEYEKTYDLRAANRLDTQAFAAMRKAQ
jgi:hypothetical protein